MTVDTRQEDDDDGFYDDCGRYWPKDAEWCDRCQGMGTEECLCGGEGYFVPTEAFKKAREETAKWWRELCEENPNLKGPNNG